MWLGTIDMSLIHVDQAVLGMPSTACTSISIRCSQLLNFEKNLPVEV